MHPPPLRHTAPPRRVFPRSWRALVRRRHPPPAEKQKFFPVRHQREVPQQVVFRVDFFSFPPSLLVWTPSRGNEPLFFFSGDDTAPLFLLWVPRRDLVAFFDFPPAGGGNLWIKAGSKSVAAFFFFRCALFPFDGP